MRYDDLHYSLLNALMTFTPEGLSRMFKGGQFHDFVMNSTLEEKKELIHFVKEVLGREESEEAYIKMTKAIQILKDEGTI